MDTSEHIETRIGERLASLGWTLTTAESCTGGLIASRITDVAGSSDYFVGGAVAYSNRIKETLLGVPSEVLETKGAVSAETAEAMAKGARKRFGADLAVGVTGIAGPGGGAADKPVGLVYIAVAGPNGRRVTRNLFSGSRREIKEQTAARALEMIWEHME